MDPSTSTSASAVAKPTLAIIQGSFQTPLFYQAFHSQLQSQGFETVHPELPSCNPSAPDHPSKTLTDDARAVHAVLTRLVEEESKPVVVIMHSYGGLVGSEAIPQSLTYTSRKAEGKAGGVLHLFYCAAFILPVGQSVLSAFGESPNNELYGNGTFKMKNAKDVLFGDLPEPEADMWASRMVPQSYGVQETKLSQAAWEYVASTYLVCEGDKAVPRAYQEGFAETAGSRVLVSDDGVGHEAMLSWTAGLVDVVLGVLRKLEGETV
ncbi:catalytic protein [Massariosphaeria phaeospora]|uniref:Catalytic protein n=1 Tax=Massariosphaeria phaeospora TaxID=100035 RepID=A0A7C8MFT0_9PLEO|nr:catalytic protein [Massariosphaeria phaeospora]